MLSTILATCRWSFIAGLTVRSLAQSNTRRPRQGDQRGWIFDFDISSNAAAQQVLQNPEAKFKLVHSTLGVILDETDYYFVSNQQGIYAEQLETGSVFLNQGTPEPATYFGFSSRPGAFCRSLSAGHCLAVSLNSASGSRQCCAHLHESQAGPTHRRRHQPTRKFPVYVLYQRRGQSGPCQLSAKELQHLHESAIHHECAVHQPAHSAE